MAKKRVPLAAYFVVHPQTPKARAAFTDFFTVVMKRIGKRWNAMDSNTRYELLLKQYRACDSTSMYSLLKWNQLPSGAKIAILALMCRADKAEKLSRRKRSNPLSGVPTE